MEVLCYIVIDMYMIHLVEELSFDDAVEPTLNQDRDTISMTLSFNQPGDRLVFYVDVVNNGSFDAKLDSINITNNLSSEIKFGIFFPYGLVLYTFKKV